MKAKAKGESEAGGLMKSKRTKSLTMRETVSPTRAVDRITNTLLDLVRQIPTSEVMASVTPEERSRTLILQASSRAAIVSSTLALPPGPLGMLTVLPDLLAIWHIQRQLVSDIAAAHGKTHELGPEALIHCLFRHAAGQAVRDVVVRLGERFLIRRVPLSVMQRVLRRVGVSVSQRAAGRVVSRWIPVIGALGIGGYAFYDTAQVGKTALAFFRKEVVLEPDAPSGEPELLDP